MSEQIEVLNIDYHKKQLAMKALQKYGEMIPAANALGISIRTLGRMKVAYDIKYDHLTKEYYFKTKGK